MMPKLREVTTFFFQRVQKLGWIDLLGVGLFLAILSIAFFFFLRRADYAYLTLRVSQSDTFDPNYSIPPIWYIEKITPGLKETDGLGREAVVVQRVRRFKSTDMNQNLFVDLKVKSVYNARTGQYSYNGSPLLIGSFQTFKLRGFQLYGTIVGLSGNEIPEEEQSFIVKGFLDPQQHDSQATVANTVVDGVRNYLVNTIQPGATVVDSDGQVTAEILERRIFDGRRWFVAGNNFISVPDPERKRVELTVRVKAFKINDAYYYKRESPLLVNSALYLGFPQSNLTLTITEVTAAP